MVCRMLGYNSSFAKAVIGSTFGNVPSTFVMDDVSIIVNHLTKFNRDSLLSVNRCCALGQRRC